MVTPRGWVTLFLLRKIENFILILLRFWNPDRTVRSDRKTLKPFIFTVLLASRTALWEKSRNPCEPRSDLLVLRTVIRPLLTVPCFHLNLNLKKKKKKKRRRKKHNYWKSRKHGCGFRAATPTPDSRHSDAPPTHQLAVFFFFFRSSKPLSLL